MIQIFSKFQKNLTLLFFMIIFGVVGCARSPIKSVDQAMRPMKAAPEYRDDMNYAELANALKANLTFLKNKKELKPFRFGPTVVESAQYIKSLEALNAALAKDSTGADFRSMIEKNFEPFEVYGQEKWGEIFMTSYYEPVIDGSRKAHGPFLQPLHGLPKDLVDIDMSAFATGGPAIARGRLLAAEGDAPPKVVPFPSRQEINMGAIRGSAKELFYVDPIDAFILQIQGSGVVKLKEGGEVNLSYAGQNGHTYVSIGRHLFDVIPKEKMTLNAIESYLRSKTDPEIREILELNPSYVFFRTVKGAGLTALGTEVVAGRTIATDAAYFPKGALAYLDYEKPEFSSPEDLDPHAWVPSSRFVLDQDTGGAIKGPHRVDLFWGRGRAGKQVAAVMKNKGRLVYLVPRPEFLATLN